MIPENYGAQLQMLLAEQVISEEGAAALTPEQREEIEKLDRGQVQTLIDVANRVMPDMQARLESIKVWLI